MGVHVLRAPVVGVCMRLPYELESMPWLEGHIKAGHSILYRGYTGFPTGPLLDSGGVCSMAHKRAARGGV